MLKNCKRIGILLFISIFLFSSVEANWITKKSDKSKEVIKEEKKQKSEWIKLKKKEIKKNKEDYKKKEKNISKAVKSWITKKTKKDKFLEINSLPNSQVYFTAFSNDGRVLYGYINDDKKSEKIDFRGKSIYKISKGKGYIQNNKAVCNIATERGIIANNIIGFVSGECSDKTKFTGEYSQKRKSGSAETDQKIKINFSFNENLKTVKIDFNKRKDSVKKVPLNTIEPRSPKIDVIPTGNYYALLIGNTSYVKWTSLTSPINDVNEIEKILKKKYNFKKITKITNGTRGKIFKALKELKSIVTDKDYVLIYYAGHGDQETQRAYWIPGDAEKEWDENWIDTVTITTAIQRIKAKHVLLMIDSCYLGTSFKGKKEIDLSDDISAKEAIKSLKNRAGIVMASGGATPVVDVAIDNKHSLFAYKFIDILKQNNDFITSQSVFLQIKKYHANQQQTPQYYGVQNWGHLDGDFVFKVKK